MQSNQGSLLRLFAAHPWVGLIGSLASVVSLPVAFILYSRSIREPAISFALESTRALVLDAHASGDIHVTYKDQPISTDLSIVQLALWNAGGAPVRDSDILDRPTLSIEPTVPILEARVVRVSRPSIQFAVDQSAMAEGSLSFSWHVLERDDGALIQLLYAGAPGAQVRLSGSAVGQRSLNATNPFTRAVASRPSPFGRFLLWVLVVVLGSASATGIGFLAYGACMNVRDAIRKRRVKAITIISLGAVLMLLGYGAYSVHKSLSVVHPPTWATSR